MPGPTIFGAIGVLLLVQATVAEAQPRDTEDPSAAGGDVQRAVAESERLYADGRFDEAAAHLRDAFEVHEAPVLLLHLGQALDGAGDVAGAIDAFERYLERAPEGPERAVVEERVATLRAQRDELEGAGGATTALRWPWMMVGAGGAVLVAGVVFGILSAARDDDAQAELVQREAEVLHEDARTFATMANVSFVVGALLAAGGVTWALIAQEAGDGSETASVSLVPGGVRVHGRF